MANMRSTWIPRAFTFAARWPVLQSLPQGAQAGIVLGAAATAVLFLLVGGLAGSLNRGVSGALIGAVSGMVTGAIIGGALGGVLGTMFITVASDTKLRLVLDRPDSHYAPGDVITGSLELTIGEPLRVQASALYLLCRGHYLHDQTHPGSPDGESRVDSSSAAAQYHLQEMEAFTPGARSVGATERIPFRFTLPADALPTHHGYACALRWTLHAIIQGEDGPIARAQQELRVTAPAPIIQSSSKAFASTAVADAAQLTLCLDQVLVAEGDTVRGRLRLLPMMRMAADEVRVVLLRVESTPDGDGHTVYVTKADSAVGPFQGERRPGGEGTTYVWLEAEAPLSGPAQFKVGQEVAYPFMLNVPKNWRPTLWTDEGSVLWKVGAVVHRSSGQDVRALHEVIVHNSNGVTPAPSTND